MTRRSQDLLVPNEGVNINFLLVFERILIQTKMVWNVQFVISESLQIALQISFFGWTAINVAHGFTTFVHLVAMPPLGAMFVESVHPQSDSHPSVGIYMCCYVYVLFTLYVHYVYFSLMRILCWFSSDGDIWLIFPIIAVPA